MPCMPDSSHKSRLSPIKEALCNDIEVSLQLEDLFSPPQFPLY